MVQNSNTYIWLSVTISIYTGADLASPTCHGTGCFFASSWGYAIKICLETFPRTLEASWHWLILASIGALDYNNQRSLNPFFSIYIKKWRSQLEFFFFNIILRNGEVDAQLRHEFLTGAPVCLTLVIIFLCRGVIFFMTIIL